MQCIQSAQRYTHRSSVSLMEGPLYINLTEEQFGFRNNQSKSDALIDIIERIRNATDKGFYVCGIFLDFKKAFHTVNHDIVLNRLPHYGIRGPANNWFHSYFAHRV